VASTPPSPAPTKTSPPHDATIAATQTTLPTAENEFAFEREARKTRAS
jgi:hypothetical protein